MRKIRITKETLARELRRLCEERGITGVELAARMGCGERKAQRILAGQMLLADVDKAFTALGYVATWTVRPTVL